MKGKFSSIWRLTLALALVLSLGLVIAAPVAASPDVSDVWVQLNSYTASASTTYHVYFTPGVDLVEDVDTITVFFPINTVPTESSVTVDPDGDAVAATTGTDTADVAGYRLEVTTPVDITAGTEVRLDIPSVTNPSTADEYTLNVYTSQETTQVESSTYTIGTTTPATSVAAFTSIVATTTYVAGAASVYTIVFTETTALAVWDTVTVVFPTGTGIPAMAAEDVTINDAGGAHALDTAPVIDGRFVTLTIPVAWTAGHSTPDIVFLLTAGITNPTYASATEYGAKIYTSKDLGIVSQDLAAAITADSISQVAFKDVAGVVDSEDTVMVSTATDIRDAHLTIETRDQYDNPKVVPVNVVFELSSSSGTGLFSIDHGTTWTAETATIDASAATEVFYYKDTAVGTATITAENAAHGWSDTWDVEVTPETVVELWDGDTLVEEYATIQAAIADALPGNVVKVGPGTYTLTSKLEIFQEGLTLESTDGAAETIITSSVTGLPTIHLRADDVTFDGFTLEDLVANQWGIWVEHGWEGITVKNNIFTGTTASDHAAITFQGESASGLIVTGATISGNVIEGMKYGINLLAGTIDSTISGNTITGLTGAAAGAIWLVSGSETHKTHGNTISGNTITDNAGSGIWLRTLTTAVPISGVYLDENVIEDNTISENANVGIEIDSGLTITDLTITENDITDNEGVGIVVGSWTAASDAIKFNNISDNDITNGYGLQNTSAIAVDATHNWWGTVVPSEVADLVNDTSSGVTTYEPWLLGTVSAGEFATGATATSLDAQATVGVKVSGVGSSASQKICVARYTANPTGTPEFTPLEDGFFDVYVELVASSTEVGIKFYDAAITSDSVAYVWDALEEVWEECSVQSYNASYGYILVKVRPYSATVPAVPTIEELNGTPFAISTEAVVVLESISAEASEVSLLVDETEQLAVTATYSDATTDDVTAESTYDSGDESVATVSTGGLITAVAEGDATITVSYTEGEVTETDTVSVTVSSAANGDFDGDGHIGLADFVDFAAAYGSSTGDPDYDAIGDFDDDGEIGLADFVEFAAVYGT